MQPFKNLRKIHILLLSGWAILNLLQAYFTNLHPDETYYWLYSKQLSWGYFDHPPMTAFLVFLGDSIMHNQLGVRLFMIVLSTLTMAMIMNELNEKKDNYFLVLFLLSFPLMHTHIGGFLALPDTPLVFFTLLFFLIYKKFVLNPNLKLSILLAFAAAAMIYSKYHAFLILGLVVLSNFELLKNKYFWISILGINLLLLPHYLWQFENQFPTFMYHLTSRTKPVQMRNIINNLYSQIVIAGPLTGVLVLYSLKNVKTKNATFNRSMLFSVIGFYIVFTIMSFWNRIEAHWTTATTPLLMLLTYPIISDNERIKKWFKRLSLPIIILFLIFRFYMAADFIPNVGYLKFYFYKQEEKALEIQKMAGNLKVATFNNFDLPGTYEFYTGDPAVHLAKPDYRYCQFDLWNKEESIIGDSLFIVFPSGKNDSNSVALPNGQFIKTAFSSDFQSLKKIMLESKSIQRNNGMINISLELANKSGRTVLLNSPQLPSIGVLQKKTVLIRKPLRDVAKKSQLLNNEHLLIDFSFSDSLIDTNQSFIIFTQTKEKDRGEMIVLELPDN